MMRIDPIVAKIVPMVYLRLIGHSRNCRRLTGRKSASSPSSIMSTTATCAGSSRCNSANFAIVDSALLHDPLQLTEHSREVVGGFAIHAEGIVSLFRELTNLSFKCFMLSRRRIRWACVSSGHTRNRWFAEVLKDSIRDRHCELVVAVKDARGPRRTLTGDPGKFRPRHLMFGQQRQHPRSHCRPRVHGGESTVNR